MRVASLAIGKQWLYKTYSVEDKSYSREKFCDFHRFLMNRESFPNKCVEQWLSSVLLVSTDEGKTAKVFSTFE